MGQLVESQNSHKAHSDIYQFINKSIIVMQKQYLMGMIRPNINK